MLWLLLTLIKLPLRLQRILLISQPRFASSSKIVEFDLDMRKVIMFEDVHLIFVRSILF